MSSSSPSPKKKKQNKAKEASATGHTAPAKEHKGSGIFTRLILYGIIPVVLVGLFFVLDPYVSKGYIFEPTVLHAAASKALKAHGNASFDKVVDSIVATLEKRYPGHINKEQQWIFNNAGGIHPSHPPLILILRHHCAGAMGQMYLLHCSLTEYVIIFGTPIGTEGFTGRFLADDYFIILKGEQQAFNLGEFARESYKPGDMHHLPRGSAQGYRCPDHCFALEYARGWYGDDLALISFPA